MIKVEIKKEDSLIKSVKVTGHADYDDYGKDIVCAGVSAIVAGTANALYELTSNKKSIIKEGSSEVKFENDHDSQLIANTMIVQLKSIEESYKSYLKIIYN